MDLHSLSESELHELVSENRQKLDADFDTEYTGKLVEHVLGLLEEYYFRSRFVGFEPLPKRARDEVPLIYVSNHSGMSFPWDAMIFLTGIYKINKHSFDRIPRPLVAPMLANTKLMSPYQMKGLWRKVGCLEANMLNFETLMNQNRYDVMIYPEGAGGMGKGFDHKYELQHMSTSFVRMAVKYKTDIIPFSTVNAEYNNPRTFTSEKVDKLAQKLGIPFIPLGGMTPLVFFQPWLFYGALPSKLTYVMGKRIKPYKMTDKAYGKMTQEDFEELRNAIYNQMQQELTEAVGQYGESPYDLDEFIETGRKHWEELPYVLPGGWPVLFREFDRQYHEDKHKPFELAKGFTGFWQTVRKHPELLPYYIPILGWVPLMVQNFRSGEK